MQLHKPHCRGGIFAERKSVSTLADRRCEKGVSSLQEPLCASISARKPAFTHRRQGSKVQFGKIVKKGFPCKLLALHDVFAGRKADMCFVLYTLSELRSAGILKKKLKPTNQFSSKTL